MLQPTDEMVHVVHMAFTWTQQKFWDRAPQDYP